MSDIEEKSSLQDSAATSQQTVTADQSSAQVVFQGHMNQTVLPLRRKPKQVKMAIALAPGFEWNPLLKLDRNRTCPCLSGKKFKACHLDLLPKAVTAEQAKQFREQMEKPDLVFITKENEHRFKQFAEEKAKQNETVN